MPRSIIQRRDRRHRGGAEFEVEHVEVARNPDGVHRLGNHDITELDMPSDQHLGGCPATILRDGGNCRMGQQRSPSQRGPRLGRDAQVCVHFAQFRLGQSRVKFDLVDRRDDARRIDEDHEVLGLEIADADRANPALITQAGECLEGVHELVERWLRPVDQIQVEIVGPEPVHTRVECPQRAVITVVWIRQFGHDVQLVARHVGIGERAPGLSLVTVGRRGVYMPITGAQRGSHRLFGVLRSDLEDSEADGGDRIAVV